MAKANRDIYQEVTNKIVSAMESGNIPWLKPWENRKQATNVLVPHNASTGKTYNGINLMLLWAEGFQYPTQQYVTYKQAKDMGGNVKRGESGHLVVFWNWFDKKNEDTGEIEKIPFLKHYTVFNLAQCENIDAGKLAALPERVNTEQTSVLSLALANGASVVHGGNKAFFSPMRDYIAMPNQEQFKTANDYEATLAHELTHWTGHKSRLERDFSGRFGDSAYAFEELIAEMGAAFLCVQLGVELRTLQHAAYLQSWIKVLKNDKKAIFTASSKSKAACKYLLQALEQPSQQAA